jgi:hypothetical protein
MDSDYPKPIRDVFGRWEGGIWQTLPDHMDTALIWPNQQIFFFKVKFFFVFNNSSYLFFSFRVNIIGKQYGLNYKLVIHV